MVHKRGMKSRVWPPSSVAALATPEEMDSVSSGEAPIGTSNVATAVVSMYEIKTGDTDFTSV